MKEALKRLLTLALNVKASDIHLTLEKDKCRIEWRVNGELEEVESTLFKSDARLFHYLKYISHCELSNMSQPQSGSFEITVNNRSIACRFALIVTRYRQSGVLRLLNQGSYIPYDKLTFDIDVIQQYQKIIQMRNGLVLISGATGSGKTTSAYSLLNAMQNRKIVTIEDPIEIFYPSLMQVQVNDAAGMSYQNVLKQLMRHDPDVIFIGEIRDELAAQMAIRSALTGHLVLATIHASNCKSAIYRILDLGVDYQQLFQVLNCITCQILVSERAHNVKFSVVEFLNEQKIASFKDNNDISYETIESKLCKITYQKDIIY